MINYRDNSLSSSNIYNPIYIFTMSVLFCSLLLFIERYFGLEWDYHPDASTYIESPLNKYKTVEPVQVQKYSVKVLVSLIFFNFLSSNSFNGIIITFLRFIFFKYLYVMLSNANIYNLKFFDTLIKELYKLIPLDK